MADKLINAAIVVVGVPGVLIGYIWGTEQVLRILPERAEAERSPVALARARPGLPGHLPRLPDDRDHHPQLPGQRRQGVRRP